MKMHGSPTQDEEVWYLDPNRKLIYGFGVPSLALLLSGMLLFCLTDKTHWPYFAFVIMTGGYLLLSYFIGIFGGKFNQASVPALDDSLYGAEVDIYLPICGEPADVVENTFAHVQRLAWHGKLNVWVLDDMGSVGYQELAALHKFNYVCRPDKGKDKKAGNLRHAFALTKAPFFVVFDADFAPSPNFLFRLMPFFKDTKTAIVQSPQFFKTVNGETWVEKGAGYVQELFYRLVQISRDKWDAAICVGTNAVYRREALEPFGGTALIGYSEDVHTGFQVTNNGWHVRYVPYNLAQGRCPESVQAFFLQQYRWAMGSLTLCGNPEFWKSKLTKMQKLCYLSGFGYYITTGLAQIMLPIPAIVMLIFSPHYVFWWNVFFTLPSLAYGTIVYGLWTKNQFTWSILATRHISYWAHLMALKDKLFGTLVPWIPTGAAVAKNVKYNRFMTFIMFWTAATSSLIAGLIWTRIHQFPAENFISVGLLTALNTGIAFFILSRD